MLSFSRCIASTESKQAASVHLELVGSYTLVAQSEALVEDLEVLDSLQDRVGDTSCDRQGVLEEVHMFRSRDIPQAGLEAVHILQEDSVVERIV